MKKTNTALALAIAATLGTVGGEAQAALYTATLTQVASFSSNGSSVANITSSTATFQYDSTANLVTQTGGTLNARFTTAPTTTLFRHLITGAVIGNGAAASASTYVCQEGNFGGIVNASLCGNYNFGGNYVNDSTLTYGPGTATSRTIGGDDMALGPEQSIAALNGMNTSSFNGTTLVVSNETATSGYRYTFSTVAQVVPVPAAVWLFGSAIGLLGVARRKSLAS